MPRLWMGMTESVSSAVTKLVPLATEGLPVPDRGSPRCCHTATAPRLVSILTNFEFNFTA
jgi:hypothetical protein